MNRGAGYGLEIPCTYRLYGPPAYVNRMQEIVESLAAYSGTYLRYCALFGRPRGGFNKGVGLWPLVGGKGQYESTFGDVLQGRWSE